MTDFVCKDAFVLINPYKQLNILNELFSELENYSFNPFVLTQIVSIRDCYGSIFLLNLRGCKEKWNL